MSRVTYHVHIEKKNRNGKSLWKDVKFALSSAVLTIYKRIYESWFRVNSLDTKLNI